MSFILSLIGLFSKSDLFSRFLVLGLCFLACMVIVVFIYGFLRFWYKKKEIKYILSLLKAKNSILKEDSDEINELESTIDNLDQKYGMMFFYQTSDRLDYHQINEKTKQLFEKFVLSLREKNKENN